MPDTVSARSGAHDRQGVRANMRMPGGGAGEGMTQAAIEDHSIAVATASLEGVATAIGSERALILAICDADGRPTDVVVRDQVGRVAVLAGVPEATRPDLGGVVALASGELRRASRADSTIDQPEPPPLDVAYQRFPLQ